MRDLVLELWNKEQQSSFSTVGMLKHVGLVNQIAPSKTPSAFMNRLKDGLKREVGIMILYDSNLILINHVRL